MFLAQFGQSSHYDSEIPEVSQYDLADLIGMRCDRHLGNLLLLSRASEEHS